MRKILAGLFIVALFLAFTWPGPLMYYSGDDLMNLYNYWTKPLPKLIEANFFFWSGNYRPFGAVLYLPLYYAFGFNPRPLYIIYYLILLLNLYLCYLVANRLTRSGLLGGLTVLFWCLHGKMDGIYYNAGTLYDVLCTTWLFTAFAIYLEARARGEFPRGWRLAAFLASFVCALNSKEMAATFPAILLIYELFTRPPRVLQLAPLLRWVRDEGRGALLAGLGVLIYLPGKLGAPDFANDAYRPVFQWPRYLANLQMYWAELFYRDAPFTDRTPMGIQPLQPDTLMLVYAALIAVALLARARWAWFGLLFFQITLLPISFVPARLGFALYLPWFGLALYLAVLVGLLKDKLLVPRLQESAAAVLFCAAAIGVVAFHKTHWYRAPDWTQSRNRVTVRKLLRNYPAMPRGARLLFVKDPYPDNFDLQFLTRLYYHDPTLFLTQLEGPPGQRIPVNRLGDYDYVFSYEDEHWVEYDRTNIQRSLRFHLVKGQPTLGDGFRLGEPGQSAYIVKGVLVGSPQWGTAWTQDNAELQFNLASAQHRVLVIEFTVTGVTLQQTGPLKMEFFVNEHLLDRATYASEGDQTFHHEVPAEWLNTEEHTRVRMHVVNPYIAPADSAHLGVLLRAARFE